jgi:hypothetical protein
VPFAVNLLDWILAKLPVLIFVLVFVFQIVRGLLRSRQERGPAVAKPDELAARRRVQEVQEEIRRRIAERRAAAIPAEPPPLQPVEARPAMSVPEPAPVPLVRETRRQPANEFHRDTTAEFESAQAKVTAMERRNAERERQQQIVDQLRSVEDTRVVTERRTASGVAARSAATQTETALLTVARGRLLEDLHDPQALRRAFVLREVLGPPVGLR